MDSPISNVTEEFSKKEAHGLCKEYLGGPWSDISVEDFGFSKFSGGLSNKLYLCSLPEGLKCQKSTVPKAVLLRIYGPLKGDSLESTRDHVITAETAIFLLLAERNLGPKLYGIFPNGRLEEYIESKSLNSDGIRKSSLKIAKELARIHALEVPMKKIPDMFDIMEKWLGDLEKGFGKRNDHIFTLKDTYLNEMLWLRSQIEKIDSPIVFCHNDLQGGNILQRENADKSESDIFLIDFEFGTYNYRGFDLANQFIEWCFDYNLKEYPHFRMDLNKFPSKQEQTDYIQTYLRQLQVEGKLKEDISLQEEISKIQQEILVFRPMSSLIWSLWSYNMSQHMEMDFAFIEYGKARLQVYQIHKEEYLKSSMYESYSKANGNH